MEDVPWRASPSHHHGLAAVTLDIDATARLGHPLVLRARSADGRSAEIEGPVVERACRQPLDESLLQRTVGALGGSGYRPGEWTLQLDPEVFVPASTLKALRRRLLEDLTAQPVSIPERWQLPHPQQRSWPPILAAVAADVPMARDLLAAGADQVWLDDPRLDLWRDEPPRIESTAPGLWLRHPAAAPVSPHLKTLGLPVVAGHLGVLRAAVEAGLEVIADAGLNVANHAAAAALAELGARAAVLSLELDAEQIPDLVARSALPCLAVAAGRRLLMASRQDHGLAAGDRQRLSAMQDQRSYTIERHIAGLTLIREAQDLDKILGFATALPGLAGIVLETGTLPIEQALAVVRHAAEVLDGFAGPRGRRNHD